MRRRAANSRSTKRYVPDIQDALPLPAADRPSKRGHLTPMEVMDAPFRGGDLRHGYQAVADNLPNDPRIHQEKGTKKIFFKNFMDARVNYVILPVAQQADGPRAGGQGFGRGLSGGTLMHEIWHGLGPAFARKREAGGYQRSHRSGILRAGRGEGRRRRDVRAGVADGSRRHAKARAEEYYASYLAGIFRTVRFGTAKPTAAPK